jgi:hypothetical protein
MQKIILILVGIIIIVMVVIGGAFAYQYFSMQKANNQQPTANQQQPAINSQTNNAQPKNQTAAPAVSWKTFKDNYGFQMQYPADKSVMSAPTSKTVDCSGSCPATMIVNNITSTYANQTINGTDYCVYSGAKAETNSFFNEYLLLTLNNGACYGLDVSFSNINCAQYTTDALVKSCKSQQGAKQALISQALSTIKFIK